MHEKYPSQRVTGFVHHLRTHDFQIGHTDLMGILDMLDTPTPLPLSAVRERMKILVSRSRAEWDLFDSLFQHYWLTGRQKSPAWPPAPSVRGAKDAATPHWQPPEFDNEFDDEQHMDSADDVPPESSEPEFSEGVSLARPATGRLITSEVFLRNRVDLRDVVDPVEMRLMEQRARQLATAMRYRLSRRYATRAHGKRLDLRKTIRRNLALGGEPFMLIRRSPPAKPVRIVVFLDVSGSMQNYSRFFLQFIKGLVGQWFDTDAYLFDTQLLRVTDVLREKDSLAAMSRLSVMATGFGGGTNLGNSLRTFNQEYAKESLNSRSVAFILSDGYDTGLVDRMTDELAQLKHRVRKLVWLNPLLGWENYRPVNGAMQAAMPYIDIFAPANSLESLCAIEPMLEKI